MFSYVGLRLTPRPWHPACRAIKEDLNAVLAPVVARALDLSPSSCVVTVRRRIHKRTHHHHTRTHHLVATYTTHTDSHAHTHMCTHTRERERTPTPTHAPHANPLRAAWQASLLNHYPASHGYIPWHWDEVRAHGDARIVASVSLGGWCARRRGPPLMRWPVAMGVRAWLRCRLLDGWKLGQPGRRACLVVPAAGVSRSSLVDWSGVLACPRVCFPVLNAFCVTRAPHKVRGSCLGFVGGRAGGRFGLGNGGGGGRGHSPATAPHRAQARGASN